MKALLAARVAADIDGVTANIAGASDPDFQSDLARTVRELVMRILALWRGGIDVPASDLDLIVDTGRRGLERGLSPDALLAALRIAQRTCWQHVVDCAARMPPSAALTTALGAMAQDLLDITDRFCAALTAAHSEGATESADAVGLIADVLTGNFEDQSDLAARAARAGHDLEAPHGILLLVARRGSETPAALLCARAAALVDAISVPTDLGSTAHTTLVVSAGDVSAWRRTVAAAGRLATDGTVIVLVVDPVVGAHALHREYAAAVLPFVEGVASRGVARMRDLLLARLLTEVEVGARLHYVDESLGPLLRLPAARRESLLDTITKLHPHRFHIQGAAFALGVDPRTIRNRAARVRQLCGFAVDSDELRVAMHLLRVSASQPDAGRRAREMRRPAGPEAPLPAQRWLNALRQIRMGKQLKATHEPGAPAPPPMKA